MNNIKSFSTEQKNTNNINNQKYIESKTLNPSLGKTIYSEYIKTEDLFTMSSYKKK